MPQQWSPVPHDQPAQPNWAPVGTLKGPPGPKGDKGDRGDQGDPGDPNEVQMVDLTLVVENGLV